MQHGLWFLGTAIWFCWFSLYTYVPILSPYVKELDSSYQMVGIVLSSYGIAQMFFRLPLGIISDKYTIHNLFIKILMFICVISALGMWMFPNIYAMLIFRTLSGVAATAWVLHPVVFYSHFPGGEATKAMGIVTAILNSGEMVGMLVGGVVAYCWGFQATFLLAAFGGTIGFLFSMTLQGQPHLARKPITWAELLEVAKDRLINLAAVLGLILQIYSFSTVFGFTPLIAKKIGLSNMELGILSTLFMLPGVLSSALSGTFFVRRFNETMLIIVSFIVMASSCIAIPFISSAASLYFWQTLSGFARGLVFPLLMSIGIRHISAAKRATTMGYSQAVYGFGMFFGPLIIGIIGDFIGLEWGFITVGFFTLAGALIATLLRGHIPLN